jgi:uncharacterized protein (DUF2267 family)
VQRVRFWKSRIPVAEGYNSYVQWFSFRIYRRTQRLDISHHLGAPLPMLVRGIYYEGWRIAGKPTKDRHIDEFIGHVLKKLPPQFPVDALTVSRGVFEGSGKNSIRASLQN